MDDPTHPRCILADDMGLGKTRQALIAASAFELPIWVIVPASLKDIWRREAAIVGVEITLYSWAKLPNPPESDFIFICDEAHYAQELASKRTKGMLLLAKSTFCRSVFLLSGTPMKNGRPSNLFPLLLAVRHPTAMDQRKYEIRYCDARPSRYIPWDISGTSHPDELHILIKDHLLRRTKAEALDLPPKTRISRNVELSDDAKAKYDTVFNSLRTNYEARVAAGEIMDNAEAIVLLNHIRYAGSIAKIDTAAEIAAEICEQGSQIVIFVAFKEAGYELKEKLNCSFLCGDVQQSQRQSMIYEFQQGNCRAIVCTFGTGGLGITLTAAQTVVLVDREWTPAMAEQAEDRLNRIGQRNAVTSLWLRLGEIDTIIDDLLLTKGYHIDTVVNGKNVRFDSLKSAAEQAKTILERIFS